MFLDIGIRPMPTEMYLIILAFVSGGLIIYGIYLAISRKNKVFEGIPVTVIRKGNYKEFLEILPSKVADAIPPDYANRGVGSDGVFLGEKENPIGLVLWRDDSPESSAFGALVLRVELLYIEASAMSDDRPYKAVRKFFGWMKKAGYNKIIMDKSRLFADGNYLESIGFVGAGDSFQVDL